MAEPISIALPKGRLLEEALPLLARAGIDLEGVVANAGRRLLLPTLVAEPIGRPLGGPPRSGAAIRVATKYPRIALHHYRSRGIQAKVITLVGSVELGAVTGLADQIVDLVESGETLRQNHLREVETILNVTSRLIVHPASLKLKRARIEALIEALRAASESSEPRREPSKQTRRA